MCILADEKTEHKKWIVEFVLNGNEEEISKVQGGDGSVFAPRGISRGSLIG